MSIDGTLKSPQSSQYEHEEVKRLSLLVEEESMALCYEKGFGAFVIDLPLAKVIFGTRIQQPLAVYSKLLVILTVFISYMLQQYDWFALYIASVAGSLVLVLLYNRPLWRLNTLLSLRLKSQSDNCFSEQPFETAKPCNPQCCSDGAIIAGDC